MEHLKEMDKFLDSAKPIKSIQDEINNFKDP